MIFRKLFAIWILKNSTCSLELFAFSESVKYFVNNDSKVYGAFLDDSKAFDKVSGYTM